MVGKAFFCRTENHLCDFLGVDGDFNSPYRRSAETNQVELSAMQYVLPSQVTVQVIHVSITDYLDSGQKGHGQWEGGDNKAYGAILEAKIA